MRKLLLLAFFIALSTHIFSQTDFRRGFIVTHNADTLPGFINYHEGIKAYRSCTFKRSEGDQSLVYKPNEIIAYGFLDDKLFEAKPIAKPDQTSEYVFLEVIVKGFISLYKSDAGFWVDKDEQELFSLVNESETAIVDGRRIVRSNNRHIAILNMLLFDCEDLRSRIKRTNLHEKPLTDLIRDYNSCKGFPVVIYKARKPWTKFTAGATTGVNISSLSFASRSNNAHLSGTFVTSKSPLIGITLDVSSPRLSERISFHADLFYTRSKYQKFRLIEGDNTTQRHYTTVEVTQLKLPFGLRYTFPERTLRPYVNAGFSNTFHLSSTSNWILESESNDIVETFERQALYIRKNQVGIWGGVGFTKSISTSLNGFVEVRYERTQGLTGSVFDAQLRPPSKIKNIQVLIGIKTK